MVRPVNAAPWNLGLQRVFGHSFTIRPNTTIEIRRLFTEISARIKNVSLLLLFLLLLLFWLRKQPNIRCKPNENSFIRLRVA